MDRSVLPKIGGVPVDRVGSAAVNEVLRPVALAGKHAMVKTGGAASALIATAGDAGAAVSRAGSKRITSSRSSLAGRVTIPRTC